MKRLQLWLLAIVISGLGGCETPPVGPVTELQQIKVIFLDYHENLMQTIVSRDVLPCWYFEDRGLKEEVGTYKLISRSFWFEWKLRRLGYNVTRSAGDPYDARIEVHYQESPGPTFTSNQAGGGGGGGGAFASIAVSCRVTMKHKTLGKLFEKYLTGEVSASTTVNAGMPLSNLYFQSFARFRDEMNQIVWPRVEALRNGIVLQDPPRREFDYHNVRLYICTDGMVVINQWPQDLTDVTAWGLAVDKRVSAQSKWSTKLDRIKAGEAVSVVFSGMTEETTPESRITLTNVAGSVYTVGIDYTLRGKFKRTSAYQNNPPGTAQGVTVDALLAKLGSGEVK